MARPLRESEDDFVEAWVNFLASLREIARSHAVFLRGAYADEEFIEEARNLIDALDISMEHIAHDNFASAALITNDVLQKLASMMLE